ncbi:hypothetical protein Adt_41772 [Abeliophyllum distichum]|uniref:Uncharacterized protein n=1 Tax=Abeliophyllum distichum TaxID=126358 RepID=A0ABD1PPR9_9LAMI
MEGMVEMSLHISMQIGYKRTARQGLRLKNGALPDHYILLYCSSLKEKPLSIDFDTKEGTYLPTGENQKYLSRVVGTRVRQFVHPYFDRWANVPKEQKARATGCVYRDQQTQEWPSVIETFKVNHQRNGEWVNERAAQDYKKWWRNGKSKRSKLALAVWQLTSTTLFLRSWERGGDTGAQLDGIYLRDTSRSHSSTTRLRDQHSTSQSTEATNALKSKMETYMHQMNEFITLLMSNLQFVMLGIQLPTPPPPPPLSPMHEEELDSLNDDDYLSDL